MRPLAWQGWDGKWDLPGGKVEPGETPETAITPEIEEELGVTVFPAKNDLGPSLPYPLGKYAELGAAVLDFGGLRLPHDARRAACTDTLQWFPLDELDKVDILAAIEID